MSRAEHALQLRGAFGLQERNMFISVISILVARSSLAITLWPEWSVLKLRCTLRKILALLR